MGLEEPVELALGVELEHEGAEAVAALHLALAEEGDGLGEAAEAGADGGVVGGDGEGVGAALEEELLDRLVVALAGQAALLGDLVVVDGGGGSIGGLLGFGNGGNGGDGWRRRREDRGRDRDREWG